MATNVIGPVVSSVKCTEMKWETHRSVVHVASHVFILCTEEGDVYSCFGRLAIERTMQMTKEGKNWSHTKTFELQQTVALSFCPF